MCLCFIVKSVDFHYHNFCFHAKTYLQNDLSLAFRVRSSF